MTKLNWFCREYMGSEIFLVPKGLQNRDPKKLTVDELAAIRGNIELARSSRDLFSVKDMNDLYEGVCILAPTIFGSYDWAIVDRFEGRSATARSPSGHTVYILEYDTDDRHCWVCIGSGNLAALKRIHLLEKDEERNCATCIHHDDPCKIPVNRCDPDKDWEGEDDGEKEDQ